MTIVKSIVQNTMFIHASFLITVLIMGNNLYAQKDVKVGWTYIQIDSVKQKWGDWDQPDWLRYFGLDAGDLDRDGNLDIVSGRYIYHNPGGDMEAVWKRTVLDDNVDAIFFLDVDKDAYADIIAMALPNLYWYEATNFDGTTYKRRLIGQVPATSHVNSQGFEKVEWKTIESSGFVIAGDGNIYAVSIPPTNADTVSWKVQMICADTSDEGIGVGDIDGDGDLDIAAGRRPEGEGEPKILVWFENQGSLDTLWKDHEVGKSEHPIDRVAIADVNSDNKADIVVTEERYPGKEPDANFWWFAQKDGTIWERNRITTQYSINNLDMTDHEKDGDIDLLTAEHKGQSLELQLWKNDGKGNFEKTIIDSGKENHLGAQFVDLDNDGDLDIIGAGWDQHQYMHVWRNDAIEIAQGSYEERPHFIVRTPFVTYYYDAAGGGFSRIIDKYGNDWIGHSTEPWDQYPASAASAYRGLPNLVYVSEKDKGAGHPGHDKCKSRIMSRNRIRTTSLSGEWEWEWTFFDKYAKLEILRTESDIPYWFLYEGTPGGSYVPEKSSYGTDVSGPSNKIPDFFKGAIDYRKLRWAYFTREDVKTTMFMSQLTPDNKIDMMSYLGNSEEGASSGNGMTVFGFGRGTNAQPLLKGKHTFLVGMVDYAVKDDQDHQKISEHIEDLVEQHNQKK